MNKETSNVVAAFGLAATVLSLFLVLVLFGTPVLFVGVADIALPVIVAGAGAGMAIKSSSLALKIVTWSLAGVSLFGVMLAVVALSLS